jgi:hypothetical protein
MNDNSGPKPGASPATPGRPVVQVLVLMDTATGAVGVRSPAPPDITAKILAKGMCSIVDMLIEQQDKGPDILVPNKQIITP